MARRASRGTTLIEVLVSVLILSVSIMAMVGLWQTNMKLTERHADASMAYIIGRKVMEQIKLMGFEVAPEGHTHVFYDANGGQASDTRTDAHKFKINIDIDSDKVSVNGTTGEIRPSADAIRYVKVKVIRIPGDVEERVTGTILVRSGV